MRHSLEPSFQATVSVLMGRRWMQALEEKMATNITGRAKRGFAAMAPEKQREIAAKGGRASHGGGRRPGSRNGTSTSR
jgi:general stress protein YciG